MMVALASAYSICEVCILFSRSCRSKSISLDVLIDR